MTWIWKELMFSVNVLYVLKLESQHFEPLNQRQILPKELTTNTMPMPMPMSMGKISQTSSSNEQTTTAGVVLSLSREWRRTLTGGYWNQMENNESCLLKDCRHEQSAVESSLMNTVFLFVLKSEMSYFRTLVIPADDTRAWSTLKH